MSDFEGLLYYEALGRPSKAEQIIIDAVKSVFNEGSELKVLYLSLGESARQRIMNLNHYYHNLKFGFVHKDLNSSGWLINGEFQIETIEFETINDRSNPCIELAKSPNGKWSFGYSYSTGGNGSGCAPHVFREPINSRNECFDIAIDHAEKWFKDCLNRNDPTNYNETLINQVLRSIEKIKCESSQLALF